MIVQLRVHRTNAHLLKIADCDQQDANQTSLAEKFTHVVINNILGDPGGDSGAEDENQNGREKYFCSSNFFPPVLIFVFGPSVCPWVSEDGSIVMIRKAFFKSINITSLL